MRKGNLITIVGSMYGRKSLELIEEIKNWRFMEIPHLAFSPIADKIFSRGSTEEIPAIHIPYDLAAVISYTVGVQLKQGVAIKAIAIDEVSFYNENIVKVIQTLLDEGIDVTVAGLDQDFRGDPFGSIGHLMALATDVRKRYSVCMKCKGAVATKTQRLLADGLTPASFTTQLIVLDSEEQKLFKYQCRCKDCHEKG